MRCFNKKQRIALALAAGGVCQSCGIPLPKHWHSDHIIPFSRGGKTDVINGQALCPQCNLKKGNRLMQKITLRNWQEDALQQFLDEKKKLFLTHATPGGGKTIHGLSVADTLTSSGDITHLIVLAPSTVLVEQWAGDAKEFYGLELKNSMLYNTMPDFGEYSGMIMTYAAMHEAAESLKIFCRYNKTLAIADEIHHVADGQKWGDSFRTAFEPAENILALTGTPWAAEGRKIPYISYGADGYAIPDYSYAKKTAIRDGVCRVTDFNMMVARDLTYIEDETGEVDAEYDTLKDAMDAEYPRAYAKTLCSIKHMKQLFEPADKQLSDIRASGTPDAGGLIVAPSIKAAHKFQDEIFMLTGQEYTIVHSKQDKPHDKIKEFRTSSERWLISVDMVTEGVDIKRLQVCVFLSTKNTELFVRQVDGRIGRVRNPHSEIDTTGFFYYTSTDKLNEIIDQMMEENKAGVELKEQFEPETRETKEREYKDDGISLADVTTEQAGLIAGGHHFSDIVVAEAIKRKRASSLLIDVPLSAVCKMIMAERQQDAEVEANSYDARINVPLTEKKSRIRSRIAKEVNRKLRGHLGRQATGKEISLAHWKANNAVGMQKTDDSTSMDMFERKLEYITRISGRALAC